MSNLAKFVMLLCIGAVLAGVSLWLIGGKKQAYDALISIDAPPEIVFSYLTDCEQRKRWQVGLQDCRPTSDTENTVGARGVVVVEMAGETVEYEEEILRYQQDEFLSVKGTGPKEISTTIFRLESQEGSTNFTYKVKAEPTGVSRLLAPFAAPETQDRIDDEVLQLKRLVEEENPNDTGSQFNEDPTISAGASGPGEPE